MANTLPGYSEKNRPMSDNDPYMETRLHSATQKFRDLHHYIDAINVENNFAETWSQVRAWGRLLQATRKL